MIWAKLLTVFDLFRFFGVLQIVVWRMLKESAVFFVLLSILAMGFGQALTGLDVADSKRDSTNAIANSLLQAFLGSPNFDYYDEDSSSYPFGLVLVSATLPPPLFSLPCIFGGKADPPSSRSITPGPSPPLSSSSTSSSRSSRRRTPSASTTASQPSSASSPARRFRRFALRTATSTLLLYAFSPLTAPTRHCADTFLIAVQPHRMLHPSSRVGSLE